MKKLIKSTTIKSTTIVLPPYKQKKAPNISVLCPEILLWFCFLLGIEMQSIQHQFALQTPGIGLISWADAALALASSAQGSPAYLKHKILTQCSSQCPRPARNWE